MAKKKQSLQKALNWKFKPFELPDSILEDWRKTGTECELEFINWGKRAKSEPNGEELLQRLNDDYEEDINRVISEFKSELSKEPQKVATRVASQKSIEKLIKTYPNLFGGSSDLTGSNNTKVAEHTIFQHRIIMETIYIMECESMQWLPR
ncbi:MAG: hypothetical protein CM15mP117_13340 [Alphaproteobacteria bacterium]|nr:MAG: hypothetical protein CM15mP117_13340 [Alphaproteobacteria bacterium]